MRIRRSAIFALVFLLPELSYGATWERIFNTPTVTVSFDTDSATRQGSKIKVWTSWVYSSIQQGGFNNGKDHGLYDCADHTFKSLSSTIYLNEQVVSSYGASPSQDVVPDSNAEAILKYVCSKR